MWWRWWLRRRRRRLLKEERKDVNLSKGRRESSTTRSELPSRKLEFLSQFFRRTGKQIEDRVEKRTTELMFSYFQNVDRRAGTVQALSLFSI